MSPWVRLDENAIDHPKFLALSDGAWRLWCEGECYCQKHLTDGRIHAAALKRFRYYSRTRVGELTAVLVAGKGPLWHPLDEGGDMQVHDYLDWNDASGDVVKARADARDRRKKWRDRHASRHASPDASATRQVPSGVGVRDPESSVEKKVAPELHTRARAFCDWYEATHERLFHVGYMGTQHDWQKALELVAKFTDAELQDGALVWFGMDDDFARKGTRTIPKFASRITGCLQEARARGIA